MLRSFFLSFVGPASGPVIDGLLLPSEQKTHDCLAIVGFS